jgi:hypothetical protein
MDCSSLMKLQIHRRNDQVFFLALSFLLDVYEHDFFPNCEGVDSEFRCWIVTLQGRNLVELYDRGF